MPDQQIQNPAQVWAVGTPNPELVGGYDMLQSAETATTIAANDLVMYSIATVAGSSVAKVLQHTTAGATYLTAGVALAAIAPGAIGPVKKLDGGVVKVKAVAGIVAGDKLQRSGATAGAVATFVPSADTDAGTMCGVALTATASGFVVAQVAKI